MSYFESFKSGQKVAGLLFSFWQERKLVIRVGQSDLMKGFPSLNTFLCKTYKQSNHRQDITVVESHSMAMFLVVEVNETSMV